MRAVLLLLVALLACVYGQQPLYLNMPGNVGATTVFAANQNANLFLSLIGYPCTQTSCNSGQCSHKYCKTDANGACQSSGDEQWTTVAGNLAFAFACCNGNDCGKPPVAGGLVTFSPVAANAMTYTGPRGQCYPVGSNGVAYTSSFDWRYTLSAATIMAKCGSGYNGWRPVLGESVGNAIAGNSQVQVSITSINNVVDPIFFNASVVISDSSTTPSAPAASTYKNGPTPGVYKSIDCGAAAQITPPPSCAATQSCTGSCGCGYISMLNRTYNPIGCGPGCPTTTFLFQVCLLCDYSFSYLSLCSSSQGGTVIVGLGGSGGTTYLGTQGCTYQLGPGAPGNTADGCVSVKWAGPCSWGGGKCDLFPVTLAGDVSDYTFDFNLHAGQGQTLQVIKLNTGTCTYGSCPDGTTPVITGGTGSQFGACPCPAPAPPTTPPPTTLPPPTTPRPTTPAPTTPAPTTPAPTTPAPTTPGPTTPAPTGPTPSPGPTTPAPPTTEAPTTEPPTQPPTTVPDTTVPDTTAPADTTAAPTPAPTTPAPTTPNNCPTGVCSSGSGSSGACDICCYTDPLASVQAFCIPDATGLVYTRTFIFVQGPFAQTIPSNAVRPNGTTPGGCPLDCECNIQTKTCDCSADPLKCICNLCTGVCEADASCKPPSTPPAGTTCPPCPISATNDLECAGNGFCDCGNCTCAANRNVTGPACDTPTGAGRFTTCPECTINGNVWCNLFGVYTCATAADCVALNGVADATCTTPSPLVCEDNCTCPPGDVSHGDCVTNDGVAQCVCDKGWHGGACCDRGGLSKGAIAGITGGAIAGIVIAGCAAFALIAYGTKKGVDWVQLKNQNMAAAHDNPMFKARTTEHVNPLSDSPRGGV